MSYLFFNFFKWPCRIKYIDVLLLKSTYALECLKFYIKHQLIFFKITYSLRKDSLPLVNMDTYLTKTSEENANWMSSAICSQTDFHIFLLLWLKQSRKWCKDTRGVASATHLRTCVISLTKMKILKRPNPMRKSKS